MGVCKRYMQSMRLIFTHPVALLWDFGTHQNFKKILSKNLVLSPMVFN